MRSPITLLCTIVALVLIVSGSRADAADELPPVDGMAHLWLGFNSLDDATVWEGLRTQTGYGFDAGISLEGWPVGFYVTYGLYEKEVEQTTTFLGSLEVDALMNASLTTFGYGFYAETRIGERFMPMVAVGLMNLEVTLSATGTVSAFGFSHTETVTQTRKSNGTFVMAGLYFVTDQIKIGLTGMIISADPISFYGETAELSSRRISGSVGVSF